MFTNKQNLLKNFQSSQKIIHLFRALEDILPIDHIMGKIIESYFKEFSFIQKDSKYLNNACIAKSKDYHIEKLLLNMISDKIENDIRSKPQSINIITETIFQNYDKIVIERDLRINKPINKFEYHREQFGYEV